MSQWVNCELLSVPSCRKNVASTLQVNCGITNGKFNFVQVASLEVTACNIQIQYVFSDGCTFIDAYQHFVTLQ